MPVLAMNPALDASSWSQPEQYGAAMATLADDDFTPFLDLADIDLDFPIYDTGEEHAQQNGVAGDADVEMHNGLPEVRSHHAMYKPTGPGLAGAMAHHHQQQQQQLLHGEGKLMGMHGHGNGVMHPFYRAAYGQQQQHHDQLSQQLSYTAIQDRRYHHPSAIPPTPTSMELRGDPSRVMHPLDTHARMALEQQQHQQYHHRKDEIDFTPLVSPAVTPQDAQIQLPAEFTVPGSYFSPLASPALIAQNQASRRGYPQHTHAVVNSATSSPVDVDMDLHHGLRRVETEPARKIRKKASAPRSVASSATVRHSPVTKPSKRKTSLNSVIPSKEVHDLLESMQKSSRSPSQPGTGMLLPRGAHDSSGAESISPEPLSENIMGPPPKPASATQSPAISARNKGAHVFLSGGDGGLSPATPASIMRLSQQQKADRGAAGSSTDDRRGASADVSSHSPMEELTLPEAATPSRSPLSLDVPNGAGLSTPRAAARKKPQLGLLDPQSAGLASPAKSSPSTSALTSPTFNNAAAKKAESKTGRAMKKRNNSAGSTLVSPALRPKISPSIKPLLPESISDETHALLLASKSNYQNILEGTHVPGVTYPEALSTNLTSKRTSHKIAEQGRRNRINTALQEMQGLLPSPAILAKNGVGDARSPDAATAANAAAAAATATAAAAAAAMAAGGTPPQQANSKAATVESAIDYIKLLQREAREKNQELEDRDKELALLRRRLDEAEKQLSGRSNGSDSGS